jgi:DNA-directed RNA polymerase subunit RPC12/RpoP
VRGENKKRLHWEKWLLEKPTKEEYCSRITENADVIECNFCSSSRVFPGPEVGVVERLSYGFFQNSSQGFIHYKTYICSGCGSDLYREKL